MRAEAEIFCANSAHAGRRTPVKSLGSFAALN
jgi:hypothetical protein